jgi:hypothetical protein
MMTETGTTPSLEDFYSAEFQLNPSNIMYQFKLRKSRTEPMFAIVKEGSKALENLKEGDVIDMWYRCTDKSIPAQPRQTRIKYICKDSTIGFKNHFVVGLAWSEEQDHIMA